MIVSAAHRGDCTREVLLAFAPDPRLPHMMPAHFGPRPLRATEAWYRDVTTLMITVRTDRTRLARHLPAPFEVAANPLLTILCSQNRDVDWLAGHGYNLISVNAAVTFRGRFDKLQGHYALVLWENLTDPILLGREVQGMPKIYADIPDPVLEGGTWTATASHFGHRIVSLSIGGLEELSDAEREAWHRARSGTDHWMGWKYVPKPGSVGAALSQPTLYPVENVVRRAWRGRGDIAWEHLTWEQNPTQCHIANAIADLPIVEHLPAMVLEGATNLWVPSDPPRVLR